MRARKWILTAKGNLLFRLFSSFVPVPNFYPQAPPPPPTSDPCLHDTANEDEPRFILDLDRHMARSSHPAPVHVGMRRGSTPPPLESESSNAPLNLTLSSSSKSGLRSPVNRDVQCGQWSVSRDPHYEITWSSSDERDFVRQGAKAADFCKTLPSSNRQPTQHKIWALTHDTRPSPTKAKQGSSPRKVTSGGLVKITKMFLSLHELFQVALFIYLIYLSKALVMCAKRLIRPWAVDKYLLRAKTPSSKCLSSSWSWQQYFLRFLPLCMYRPLLGCSSILDLHYGPWNFGPVFVLWSVKFWTCAVFHDFLDLCYCP